MDRINHGIRSDLLDWSDPQHCQVRLMRMGALFPHTHLSPWYLRHSRSTVFLMGPVNQIKRMMEESRIIATVVYVGAIIGTLVIAFKVG